MNYVKKMSDEDEILMRLVNSLENATNIIIKHSNTTKTRLISIPLHH